LRLDRGGVVAGVLGEWSAIMKVRLRLYGQVKSKIGQRELIVEVASGANLKSLLMAVQADYASKGIREEDFDKVSILINGRSFSDANDRDTVLSDGDSISILPYSAGG
jgi:MoaD family protein